MAEEHAESRDRIEHQPPQQVGVGQHPGGLLPQAQQLGAKIMLHLGAVEQSSIASPVMTSLPWSSR